MATNTSTLTSPDDYFSWLAQFLGKELEPYPGRALAVTRIVIAATLSMIVIMTFQIHGGGLGALYAFFIARDDLQATIKSAIAVFATYTIGLCFVLVGANLFADEPTGRFLWFAVSIFVVFFVMRTVDTFNARLAFTLLVVNTLPGWLTVHVAEPQVERTLDQALAVAVGTLITVAVEVAFHALRPREELLERLEERWDALRELLL
jgi:multidrug resistance protein MdtO